MKRDENFYDVLKIDKGATVPEIVSAYHSAKSAFSNDSAATYSLLTTEESTDILDKIEEAYQTLSNIEKKRAYDKWLLEESGEPFSEPKVQSPKIEPLKTEEVPTLSDSFQPSFLKEERERRGLSLDDISRITKVPVKFIIAIENIDTKKLPARVYVQGFIKNLATLYKLDPKVTATAYLKHLDNIKPE